MGPDPLFTKVVKTRGEQETYATAKQLGRSLRAGAFVLLHGDLGAGKTVFVRGLAEGLGADPETVTSPTFVLIQHYKGPVPLVHADLYRLDTGAAVDDLGLEELGQDAVVAVEWAERMPHAPAGSIDVTIEDAGDNNRKITITQIGNSALPS